MKVVQQPRTEYDKVIKSIAQESNSRRVPILESINWLFDNHLQDNGYCQEPYGKITEENWQEALAKAEKKQTKIFFANDTEPLKDYDRIKKFEIVICPVHELKTIDEYSDYFEWFGFCTRKNDRHYTLSSFLKATENKKRWSMGWRSINDHSIICFDGFDTTLPSSMSRFGKVIMPNGSLMDNKKRIKTAEIIIANIINLDYFARSLWLKYTTKEYQLCLRSWIPSFSGVESET